MSITHRTRSTAAAAASPDDVRSNINNADNEEPTKATEDEDAPKTFTFDNITYYATYAEMVAAKRQRNQDMLISSGLMDAKASIDASVAAERSSKASARGIKRNAEKKEVLPRRKSSRIAGESAPNLYVENESGGRVEIKGAINASEVVEYEPLYYNGRVNDGSPLSVGEAVNKCEGKWVSEDGSTAKAAEQFVDTLSNVVKEYNSEEKASSSTVARNLQKEIDALSLDDESNVAKVTPDRIYSVACHPSTNHLIVCAGDKQGYLGIWNVDQYNHSTMASKKGTTDGVHLFKPHVRPVSTLAWNPSGSKLLSSSYDGTVRRLDAEKQVFDEVFGTYSEEKIYEGKIGYGLDGGYRSWVQCMELDNRNGSDGDCFFLATSEGTVMHIDLRSKGEVTFDHKLSEKKINTVSLHTNGHTMATAGLDTTVKIWDIRRMKGTSKPIATQNAGKSVNSAFFSPSGRSIVTTTQANTLEILEDAHLSTDVIKAPKHRIRHDNHTGRWISTFQAKWHPSTSLPEESFVVGSMSRPRTIEVFSGDSGKLLRGICGDALAAVASRCCFHPNADRLIVVGGNSSGRVTVAR